MLSRRLEERRHLMAIALGAGYGRINSCTKLNNIPEDLPSSNLEDTQ